MYLIFIFKNKSKKKKKKERKTNKNDKNQMEWQKSKDKNKTDKLTLKHIPVGTIGNGKYMGWNLMALFPLVQLNHFLSIDGKPLVWVHHNAK